MKIYPKSIAALALDTPRNLAALRDMALAPVRVKVRLWLLAAGAARDAAGDVFDGGDDE